MRKTLGILGVSNRGQGAAGTYGERSPELSGGSVVCGNERGRRPGSQAGKQRVSEDARDHAGHTRLNQRLMGGQNSLKFAAGGRRSCGGVWRVASSLVAWREN